MTDLAPTETRPATSMRLRELQHDWRSTGFSYGIYGGEMYSCALCGASTMRRNMAQAGACEVAVRRARLRAYA